MLLAGLLMGKLASSALIATAVGPQPAQAMTQWVTTFRSPSSFPLVSSGGMASIAVDSSDFFGVRRASADLATDIYKVSGRTPRCVHDLEGVTGPVVIIGVIGKSRLIDGLIKRGMIDVSRVRGKWESHIREVVRHPFPKISEALVIAGSDLRGTIYGVYDLSEQIGVSPWNWWADVAVHHHPELFVRDEPYFRHSPAVKYRGIFLNDEAPSLTNWVIKNYGNYNHRFYEKVFELVLRLKANTLWPAMWNNCFSEDDPLNPKEANDYGIVMGTSHVEPMMRADKEWNRLGYTADDWNFLTHKKELLQFWKEGLERNKPYENLITIAMRGKIDTPMSESANIRLLEDIVAAQRKIISETINPDPAQVPQVWALYKEVQEYYDEGMRVPDDVTLLWCDDNWGNIRRLPTATEKSRQGGAGVYYHFDYVGDPRNYKWINTNSIPKVWEQMHLAHEYGANQLWIVNVGDLKPMEFPMQFFLDYAWDPDAIGKDDLFGYARHWAQQQFASHSSEIAEILLETGMWMSRRKPEQLDDSTYSLVNYNEFANMVGGLDALLDRAQRIAGKLGPESHDAYFELVLHPIKALDNLYWLYYHVALNRYYSQRGYRDANHEADLAEACFRKDQEITQEYHQLHHGKWDHMMDQTHIGYTSWQQPDRNVMPNVTRVLATAPADPSPLRGPSHRVPPLVSPSQTGYFDCIDGAVAIEAEHFSDRGSSNGVKWQKIPFYGRTLSGMSPFPSVAKAREPGHGPYLDYRFHLPAAVNVVVHTVWGPTLGFQPGHGRRVAVAIDGAKAREVDISPEYTSAAWEKSVTDNCVDISEPRTHLQAGVHTVRIWMVDPGVVLERVIIDAGGLKPSLLGPQESPFVEK